MGSKVLAGRLIPTTSLASFYQTFCWAAAEMHIKKDEEKVPAMSNPDSVSAAIQPHIKRKIEQCNDVEQNPGPTGSGNDETPVNDIDRVSKIESDLIEVREMMEHLDK